jgi:hypothetical protein
MNLVRTLFFLCARFDFECRTIWIAGCKNDIADAISRKKMDRFRTLAPEADLLMTNPADLAR